MGGKLLHGWVVLRLLTKGWRYRGDSFVGMFERSLARFQQWPCCAETRGVVQEHGSKVCVWSTKANQVHVLGVELYFIPQDTTRTRLYGVLGPNSQSVVQTRRRRQGTRE
jgi:hypothetical protein